MFNDKALASMKTGLLAICVVAISACSANKTENMTEEQLALKAKNEQRMEELGYKCRREKVVGSSIPKKICDTREQREARANKDREIINEMIRTTPAENF